ncbi:unnamed protein product [Linum tenue]|uniref:Ribosomal RNA-processing protein 17 n=1 Tax=Linum tenue TaxID=586396 RepID=A0AAV0PBK5_9ROSI|nr:unnamed protein product [Linum tenue]
MADELEDGGPGAPATRVSHIKKRALKNKALAISFNEKDLRDYVTGFHKRKKKRRKEGHKQQEEAARRKRIELRQKRRLEDVFYIEEGAPPAAEEIEEDDEGGEESEPVASVSGTMMYDHGDLKVTVTTSEISREDDDSGTKETMPSTIPRPIVVKKKNQKLPVSKKPSFKKSSKRKTRAKPQSKRDKRKAKLPSHK